MRMQSRCVSESHRLIGLALMILMLSGCGGSGSSTDSAASVPPSSVASIAIPVQTDDGWEPAALAEVGMTEQPLVDALNEIRRGQYNEIHGLVVVKNGKLVLEEYGSGRMYDGSPDDMFTPEIRFNRDTLHIVHSVSKSFMSTLVGLAIRDGFIESEDVSVLRFFPEHVGMFGPEKEQIRLRHLMTMTSGLDWNEWDVAATDFENSDAIKYQRAPDPSAYFFGKDLIDEPGSTFYYNTAGFQIIGEVIRRATGMNLDDYARQVLFQPLGVQEFEWPQYAHGPVFIVGDILLRPRDMAKFGQMVLQNGRWNDQQVVPAVWLASATADFISVAHTGYKAYKGYGFHWWVKDFRVGANTIPAICADGLAGQAIMIFPTLEMVVVVTSGNYDAPAREHDLVSAHVLPSAIG